MQYLRLARPVAPLWWADQQGWERGGYELGRGESIKVNLLGQDLCS